MSACYISFLLFRIYTPYVDLSVEEINTESHEIYGTHLTYVLNA